ncbi:MAG: hypothetical protein ACPH3H_07185, partial [Pseudomonadales bacterium]
NQVSFLVPTQKLQNLIANYQLRGRAVSGINEYIGRQLQADQQQKKIRKMARRRLWISILIRALDTVILRKGTTTAAIERP